MADEVIQPDGGDQHQETETIKASLGWRAALSDTYKDDPWAKEHGKVTDFFESAVKVKAERDDLNAKLEKAIFKPGKGATDEEITAYRKAMGIPSKPDEYEFPETEGVEHDPKMMEWASKVFFEAGLSKEQGALISKSWDGFVQGMMQAEEELRENTRKEALETLKEEWGAEFKGNMELIKRGWKAFSDEDFDKFVDETNIGNHPALIRFVFKVGKAMGEDFTPAAQPGSGSGEKVLGMDYEGMEHFK